MAGLCEEQVIRLRSREEDRGCRLLLLKVNFNDSVHATAGLFILQVCVWEGSGLQGEFFLLWGCEWHKSCSEKLAGKSLGPSSVVSAVFPAEVNTGEEEVAACLQKSDKTIGKASSSQRRAVLFIYLFCSFFLKKIYFYFILLYNTVLVLPYIDMNPPQVYMRSQGRNALKSIIVA